MQLAVGLAAAFFAGLVVVNDLVAGVVGAVIDVDDVLRLIRSDDERIGRAVKGGRILIRHFGLVEGVTGLRLGGVGRDPVAIKRGGVVHDLGGVLHAAVEVVHRVAVGPDLEVNVDDVLRRVRADDGLALAVALGAVQFGPVKLVDGSVDRRLAVGDARLEHAVLTDGAGRVRQPLHVGIMIIDRVGKIILDIIDADDVLRIVEHKGDRRVVAAEAVARADRLRIGVVIDDLADLAGEPCALVVLDVVVVELDLIRCVLRRVPDLDHIAVSGNGDVGALLLAAVVVRTRLAGVELLAREADDRAPDNVLNKHVGADLIAARSVDVLIIILNGVGEVGYLLVDDVDDIVRRVHRCDGDDRRVDCARAGVAGGQRAVILDGRGIDGDTVADFDVRHTRAGVPGGNGLRRAELVACGDAVLIIMDGVAGILRCIGVGDGHVVIRHRAGNNILADGDQRLDRIVEIGVDGAADLHFNGDIFVRFRLKLRHRAEGRARRNGCFAALCRRLAVLVEHDDLIVGHVAGIDDLGVVQVFDRVGEEVLRIRLRPVGRGDIADVARLVSDPKGARRHALGIGDAAVCRGLVDVNAVVLTGGEDIAARLILDIAVAPGDAARRDVVRIDGDAASVDRLAGSIDCVVDDLDRVARVRQLRHGEGLLAPVIAVVFVCNFRAVVGVVLVAGLAVVNLDIIGQRNAVGRDVADVPVDRAVGVDGDLIRRSRLAVDEDGERVIALHEGKVRVPAVHGIAHDVVDDRVGTRALDLVGDAVEQRCERARAGDKVLCAGSLGHLRQIGGLRFRNTKADRVNAGNLTLICNPIDLCGRRLAAVIAGIVGIRLTVCQEDDVERFARVLSLMGINDRLHFFNGEVVVRTAPRRHIINIVMHSADSGVRRTDISRAIRISGNSLEGATGIVCVPGIVIIL